MHTDTMLTREICQTDVNDHVRRLAWIALERSETVPKAGLRESIIEHTLNAAVEDLVSYHRRDPSVRQKSVSCLLSRHSTYFAVLCYRLAHYLISHQPGPFTERDAMHLGFYARSQTGVEIHPEAKIGRRFIIDHGWGTVVGQTVEMGDDCYVLNNVTLGGRAVADATDGKRHPTLGNRVQVCAGAKVFGPLKIADDCFIGPDVTIKTNIAAGKIVVNKNSEPLMRLTPCA